MELLREILGVILPLLLVPIAGYIGVELAQLIHQHVIMWKDGRHEREAFKLVGWVHDKFPDLVETAKVQKAIDRMAKKVPWLDRKDIEEFICAAHQAFGRELGLNGKKVEFSSEQKTS